jgi:hypothetical protein
MQLVLTVNRRATLETILTKKKQIRGGEEKNTERHPGTRTWQ